MPCLCRAVSYRIAGGFLVMRCTVFCSVRFSTGYGVWFGWQWRRRRWGRRWWLRHNDTFRSAAIVVPIISMRCDMTNANKPTIIIMMPCYQTHQRLIYLDVTQAISCIYYNYHISSLLFAMMVVLLLLFLVSAGSSGILRFGLIDELARGGSRWVSSSIEPQPYPSPATPSEISHNNRNSRKMSKSSVNFDDFSLFGWFAQDTPQPFECSISYLNL